MFWRTMGAASCAVLLMTAQAAVADSGTFEILRGLQREYVTVDHGTETYVGGFLRGTSTITASSGGPFVVGEPSVTECLVFSRRAGESIAIETPCVSEDSAGDVFFTAGMREQGTIEAGGGGGAGRVELRGGTGKYRGVRGGCSYQARYLDGWAMIVGSCEWSRP